MARSKAGAGATLSFERPIAELEEEIRELRKAQEAGKSDVVKELRVAEERLASLMREIFSQLTPWQRVQLARHPNRPLVNHFLDLMFTDVTELHGDRLFGDDPAIVAGLARFEDQSVVVIGHQKGRETREKITRNFGMPHPEGYRKALRLMQLADKFRKPIITFIDTPGAYPGIAAEERGQAEAIARNLREMSALRVPVVAVVTGEGGSGGALAIGVGNRVLMLRYAVYSVISPEGCAAILWGDAAKAAEAAEIMKITATDLQKLGVIDEVVAEPAGGAHRDWDVTALNLKAVLADHLRSLRGKTEDALVNERHERFRRIGAFEEEFRPSS